MRAQTPGRRGRFPPWPRTIEFSTPRSSTVSVWVSSLRSWCVGPVGSATTTGREKPKYHSATACDGSIIRHCAKKSAGPGKWARASTSATYIGGNTAYWDTY
ncbi:hypothetical protein ELQ92_14365 [Labedella populi]|uniref:Uncharacterized protein n=1 Tax=Labedella populi TaxID=2498850 RepID=A0A444Q3Q9_9MICO|nr:hypothetical protein ELQ92_14365 [Labedella populi]